MVATIKDGRYKIWRSPEQHQLIIAMDGPNSLAVLGRPEQLEDPSNPETGIWILTTTSSSDTASIASERAVSATLQHEVTKAYLAIDNPSDPGRGASIYVKSDNRQVWTINPASTTGDVDNNEFHIGYPDLVDGQVLVVDNSFARAFPPRLALQALENNVDQIGLPWRFESVA